MIENQKIEVDIMSYDEGITNYKIIVPDVFMVCMSVHELKGYRHLNYLHEMWSDNAIDTMAYCQEIRKLCPDVPCILVGTQIDIRETVGFDQDCYTKEEMGRLSYYCKCDGYTECSAINNYNVTETFEFAIRHAMKYRKNLLSKSKDECIIL